MIRAMTHDDWPAVEAIYREGIATGNATFETEPPSWHSFDSSKVLHSRLVWDDGGVILGWVAASPVSSRAVYSGVVEHSVYVAASARGRGIGASLLNAFIESAEDNGVWTIQSGIFPENEPSMSLHRAHGFRTVGHRERIALMTYGPYEGQWRDTVLIERRRP